MFYRRAFERLQRESERERRTWETERQRLLDHIMLLSGNAPVDDSWVPPPSEPEPSMFMHPDELLDEEMTLG